MNQSISVNVETQYLASESLPNESRFVHAYTISISNDGDRAAQLISRQWRIIDGNDSVQQVQGLGVIGKQPVLQPGESYQYTSGVVLETESGMMEGSYVMRDEQGREFIADIPTFALVTPSALH